MDDFYTTCQRCHNKNRFLAKFCANCGKRQPLPFITRQHHRLINMMMVAVTVIVLIEAIVLFTIFSQ
ncbi:hypothetical protein PVA45_05635 [Entomospira entomophila]|uniref:Uncharacterized protein n=1 Tax=Entomospira entomophila TaxID=2719988 RepID=A0A968KRQ7_9SPIO|nr:hypothetical protein [Entomospira entomophilus]NIZ40979.1 hypothetical protein [Entomospira entomophilus]WDI35192.1 hypothetical protein PVA45_05635 [Entomospira entomophilus]